MTWINPAGALKLRAKRWWLVAAALLLFGTGCLVVGMHGHQTPLAGPAAAHPAPSSSHPSHRATAPTHPANAPVAVARSVPVALRIPALGLAIPVFDLGLNPDGTVQV